MHPFVKTVIILMIPVSLYFLLTKAFPRLAFSESNYGEYYWFRAPWLFSHTLFGILATLIGPFQFIPAIRKNYPVFHRTLGKTYLVSVLLAALTSLYLALTSAITMMYTIGLILGAGVWLFTGFMAFRLIKQGKVEQHRQWMVRNYVVTFFFIIFFAVFDLLTYLKIGSFEQLASILPLACLLIPLAITEIILGKWYKNSINQ